MRIPLPGISVAIRRCRPAGCRPTHRRVTARIDAGGLLSPAERLGVDVLNGIAYDPADQTFLLTGKWWPRLFRVKFVK